MYAHSDRADEASATDADMLTPRLRLKNPAQYRARADEEAFA
jgi:hypothetical protein